MKLEDLESKSYDKVIIFYDGVCNLCNGFVRFVIRRDPKQKVLFCPLQDPEGVQVRQELGIAEDLSSIIGLHKGKYYDRSDAVFLIIRATGGLWLGLYPLRLIPRFIRDRIYTWVANNRYKWFGKKETCELMTDVDAGHFVRS